MEVATGMVVNVGEGGKAGVNVLVGELPMGAGGADELRGRLQATTNRIITDISNIR